MGQTKLTYENFYTVLTCVEAILNSRPISMDSNDFQPLTLSHFLIGQLITTLYEPDVQQINTNRHQYQHVLKLTQHIWNRWSKKYLHNLQQQTKWILQDHKVPKIRSLLLLIDKNSPPLSWKTSRILQLYPGKDGIIREANVKTVSAVYKWPINKLCFLSIEDNI